MDLIDHIYCQMYHSFNGTGIYPWFSVVMKMPTHTKAPQTVRLLMSPLVNGPANASYSG